MEEVSSSNSMRKRGRRKPRRSVEYFGFWGFLAILLFTSNCIEKVYALPLTQAETTKPSTSPTTTTAISHASPSPVVNVVSSTRSRSSVSSSVRSSTTTSIHGTVVTDSPLVRSKLSSALPLSDSFSRNQSIASGASGSIFVSASSTIQSPTILPSPTTDDGDGDNNNSAVKTYNSLVNFYFLILAAFIGFAVLGWWIWRRRRKGKTIRDQRRGLEALRRDMELGRLRRGFLGVVGRGGSNNPTPNEELPEYYSRSTKTNCRYQPVRSPPSALTRPPGYNETVSPSRPRTANEPLHIIEEENPVLSQTETPDIPHTTSGSERQQ